MRLAFAVLCDYGEENFEVLDHWLTSNCAGGNHFDYTRTDPAYPQVRFQFKNDAEQFDRWVNSDATMEPYQQYLKECVSAKTPCTEIRWRNLGVE